MIYYGIGILLLIINLKTEFPDVTQPWYADNAGALGMFAKIKAYFYSLKRHGPGQGYYPEPSKSELIVHPDNPKAGKLFGLHHGFKVCMCTRCLGGYIGDDKSKRD